MAVWFLLSPVYDRVISAGAETLMRAFEHPKVTRLEPQADNYVTVNRSDFDPRSKRPAIPLRDLTFNFVLLCALFSATKRPFTDRNIGGFAIAMVVLALTHILAAVTEVMSIYVAKLGPWSRANYSDLARNVWGVANHSYRLVLMYAIAFALWWIFRDPSTEAAKPAKKPKKRR
ncbi:MAG TPA: exosortase H-associated membrane protein [Thermoanaerobaculia bacterium]|nr:exosortase H-associated membrane protein [Thermoanaerobaculia bacterium]